MAQGQRHPARPRAQAEIAKLPRCPEIVSAAKERGISQVVHFTTVRGATGVLAKGAIQSRRRLPEEDYLEHVYQPNAKYRKDIAWLDYVNLSITRINDWMFDHSVHWHTGEHSSWVVLVLDVELLGDPGVVFATTNNIYPSCRRYEGLEGFDALFADRVLGRFGKEHTRAAMRSDWPTDRQAEVLYPGEVPRSYLRRIDVQRGDVVDSIHGILGGLDLSVPVCHAPEVFK